jgi:hypothetical protein
MTEKAQKKHRGGSGRGNLWKPTDEQRESAKFLTAAGATPAQVALHLGVARDTVEKHLGDELKYGRELADLGLVGKLYRKAMGSGIDKADGDTACLIYLAKVRLQMWDRPPTFPHLHPNDIPSTPKEGALPEVHVMVRYRYPSDAGALAPPPLDRLPQTIEAEAKPV